jgi:glycosyltransferase involved in cell wall biosynthesis
VPVVSIVLRVHGDRITVNETIASIHGQTFQNWELIVCFQAITIEVKSILDYWVYRDSRIRLLEVHGHGDSTPLLLGIDECRESKYLAIIDSDDIMLRKRLELQVNFLNRNSDYVVVGGQRILFDSNDKFVFNYSFEPIHHGSISRSFFRRAPFAHPATLICRAALSKVGGYRREFPITQDCELWLRILKIGKGKNLYRNVIAYRVYKPSEKSNANNPDAENLGIVLPLLHVIATCNLPEELPIMETNLQEWIERQIFKLSQLNLDKRVTKVAWIHLRNSHFKNDIHFQSWKTNYLDFYYRKVADRLLWRIKLPIMFIVNINKKRILLDELKYIKNLCVGINND